MVHWSLSAGSQQSCIGVTCVRDCGSWDVPPGHGEQQPSPGVQEAAARLGDVLSVCQLQTSHLWGPSYRLGFELRWKA